MSQKQEKTGDTLSGKFQKCQVDAMLKTTGGVGLGALGSVMLWRMSVWPVVFGAALGMGLAYTNCQQNINKSLREAVAKN